MFDVMKALLTSGGLSLDDLLLAVKAVLATRDEEILHLKTVWAAERRANDHARKVIDRLRRMGLGDQIDQAEEDLAYEDMAKDLAD